MNPCENRAFYQTGQTTPRKNHQGLIAFLLILVIILCGIITALGMMNVRLFRMLEQSSTSVQFSTKADAPATADMGVFSLALGISAQDISATYRSYNNWPEGIYISNIEPNGPAAHAGLRPGDILMTLNGAAIPNEAAFLTASQQLAPGQQYALSVFRDNASLTLTITATSNE